MHTEEHTKAPAGYAAALQAAALADHSASGRIWMRGRDRAALLHRLSTNDITRLRPGQGARTVLTTPIGRIIDLLTVYALEDALLLLTSPGQGPAVFAHLRKNIFFKDQVTLDPAGRTHGQLALYGPHAGPLLAQLSGEQVERLALHEHTSVTLAGAPVLLARGLPLGGQGWVLLPPAEQQAAVVSALAVGAAQLSPDAYEALRVEHGYGAFGHELGQEYIPLETGLLDAISFTKGCYVGQEIIARMESRSRMAKQLRGLRLDRLAHAPAKLTAGGQDAGNLTSAVESPRFGPIGLAYVRSAHAAPGTVLAVGDAQAEVVELPFV